MLVTPSLLVGTVLAIFSAIIGAYAYVTSKTGKVADDLDRHGDIIGRRIESLAKELRDWQKEVIYRLAKIEAYLEERKPDGR